MPILLGFFGLVVFFSYVELTLLVAVAAKMGFLSVIGLCILTGLIGGGLVRRQGIQTLLRIQQQSARGQLPAQELVEGLVLFATGILLVTPGFVTDVLGFLVLVPQIRAAFAARVAKGLANRVKVNFANQSGAGPFGGQSNTRFYSFGSFGGAQGGSGSSRPFGTSGQPDPSARQDFFQARPGPRSTTRIDDDVIDVEAEDFTKK